MQIKINNIFYKLNKKKYVNIYIEKMKNYF